MKPSAAFLSLTLALIVAGAFAISNIVPFHWCWYMPLRARPYAGKDTLIPRFEAAIREGKVEFYGFPLVYKWHGFDDQPFNEVALGVNATIGNILTLVTWLAVRKVLRRSRQGRAQADATGQ